MTLSRPRLLILTALLLVGVTVTGAWLVLRPQAAPSVLVLYSNIDIRSVDLAFNDAGRIARVLVEEGAPVRQGQPVAMLDAVRFVDAMHQAQATLHNAVVSYERQRTLALAHLLPQQSAEPPRLSWRLFGLSQAANRA